MSLAVLGVLHLIASFAAGGFAGAWLKWRTSSWTEQRLASEAPSNSALGNVVFGVNLALPSVVGGLVLLSSFVALGFSAVATSFILAWAVARFSGRIVPFAIASTLVELRTPISAGILACVCAFWILRLSQGTQL